MDFVDEKSVDGLRNALKESIAGLQVRMPGFDASERPQRICGRFD
jgi:hypothetical protein